MEVKEQILDAAEPLFAEKGFDGVSVREITRAAEVNVAAVHYHFGSKKELYLEMVRRYTEPLNADRMRRLDAWQAGERDGIGLFAALIDPIPDMLCEARKLSMAHRLRLAGRIFTDLTTSVQVFPEELFREVQARFFEAARRAFRDCPETVLRMRFALVVGMFGGSLVQLAQRAQQHPESINEAQVRRFFLEMRHFAAAGFSAPTEGEGRT
jgi:AcrR family transcriptional regulator